jgi:serine/threonine protein kinase
MTSQDRIRVTELPEWQTFVAQAPKIVDMIEETKKEETIEFMRNTASLYVRIAQLGSSEPALHEATGASTSADRTTNTSVQFLFGSLLALQAASTFNADVDCWKQPYAAKLSPAKASTAATELNDANAEASLMLIIQGSIKERVLLGGASLLKMLLRRELMTSRLHSEKLSSLAREVNVQPLFQAYDELKVTQHKIRAVADAKDLAQQVAIQEQLHQKCTQLAAVLTSRLREMVFSQRQRFDHVRNISADIGEALVSCQSSPATRMETNIESSSSGLPEFLMEGDAFADIEEALQGWEAWETKHKPASLVFSATDDALVHLNNALSHELITLNSMKDGTMLEGRDRASNVVQAASRFVKYLDTNMFDLEVHQTESLLADCNSLVSELGTIDADRKEAQEAQTELNNVMAAYLKASEAVIRNNAELELLRLHGTSGDDDVTSVETKLVFAKKSVANFADRQSSLEARLAGFALNNVPELLFSADPKLAKRLMYTGLVVNRRLSDYEQLEVLHGSRHHVLLVQLNNHVVVLKEIALNNEAARKVFENEVILLWKLDHPAIIKVDAIFYEGLRAYIQMPYIDRGTLGQWLASNPKPWEVQSVFRQLVQGLAFMHDHGVVHRDIKMDNVLMTSDTRPIICDFGISHEATGTTSTGSTRERTTGGGYAPAGTHGYIAPEVLCGRRATPAADMWATGVLLCRAYLGCEPAVAADGTVSIPGHFSGEPVHILIEGCLRTCPDKRLTANEVLANPFFSVSTYSRSLSESKQMVESGEKIELLRRQAKLLRRSGTFALHVRRAQVVEDAIEVCALCVLPEYLTRFNQSPYLSIPLLLTLLTFQILSGFQLDGHRSTTISRTFYWGTCNRWWTRFRVLHHFL